MFSHSPRHELIRPDVASAALRSLVAIEIIAGRAGADPSVNGRAANKQMPVRGQLWSNGQAVALSVDVRLPLGERSMVERAGRSLVSKLAVTAGVKIQVVVHGRHPSECGEAAQVVGITDEHALRRQVAGLIDQVVSKDRVDRGRASGIGVPILVGNAKINRTMIRLRGIDERIVPNLRILCRIQANAGSLRVADDVVPHHAANAFVILGVDEQVKEFRAGVKTHQNSRSAGPFDAILLDKGIG